MVETAQTPDYRRVAIRINTDRLWNAAAIRAMQPFTLSTLERFMPVLAERCQRYFGPYPVTGRLLDLPGQGNLHCPEHLLRQEPADWEIPQEGASLMRGLIHFLNQARPASWLFLYALLQASKAADAIRPALIPEREAFLRSVQADWLVQGRHGDVLLALCWYSAQGNRQVVILDCQFEPLTRYGQFPAARRYALQQLGPAGILEQQAWFFVIGLQERSAAHLIGDHYYRRYWHFASWPALLPCWETQITQQESRFGTGFARFRRILWDRVRSIHTGSLHEKHQDSRESAGLFQ
ncbi:MAG: hypothetical protein KDI15_12810 [Thiothrix sp.]|nr:hypothetical protein [Thiothrix sp.]HPE59051.1 hypothetical protein [Thiolinea sp.]